ncbi:MAG: twin-arginine translocase subunit TatC [Polyangiaceae bacterium]|nr:twin-arginine translocase subunit TatC [Polyangiaceae bacterium]
MSFWDHLEELRTRVVRALLAFGVGVGIGWYYKEKILAFIYQPFHDSWLEQHVPDDPSLNFKSPSDVWTAYFNLSMMAGVVIAFPFILYQLWAFIAPGLYAREKKIVIPFILSSTVLFIGGAYVGYLTAFEVTYGYFLSLAGDVGGILKIKPTIMMDEYISSVITMLLAFGIIFEIPILATFLARIGLLTHKKMLRWARYYIFLAFLIAGVVSPPEATSQLVMAIPACLLYGASIGLVYMFQTKEAVEAENEREAAEKEEKEQKEKEERLAKSKSKSKA